MAMATFYDPMHMNGADGDDDRVHLQIRKTNAAMVGLPCVCMHVATAFGNFGVVSVREEETERWINLCIVRP